MIPAFRRRFEGKVRKILAFQYGGPARLFWGWYTGFGEIKKCRLGSGGRKRSLQPQPAWILPINTTKPARETFAAKDMGVFCRQDGLVIGESGLIFVDCATYLQGKRMVTVVP